jgi:hypothetical protein
MVSEMHLAPQEWPCVLPAIQAVLTTYHPLIRQAKRHLQPSRALTTLHPIANHSLSFIKAQQLAESTKLSKQVVKLQK